MKKAIAILLCFLITFTQASLSFDPLDLKFYWQSHSYNDLRQFENLLKKRNTLFKYDLYFLEHKDCSSQKGAAKEDPRGCFVLTHDEPVKGVEYFTSYDLISLFDNPTYAQYFETYPGAFALCFKNEQNFCKNPSSVGIGFKGLIDDLYASTLAIKSKNPNIKLEFVQDGAKQDCAKTMWTDWKYTWIRKRDPDQAFLPSTDDYLNRFAVFNDDMGELKGDSLKHFGKFLNGTRRLQLWEPEDQNEVLQAAAYFNSVDFKPGYAYAINQDPAIFQIYAANESKEAWNERIISLKDTLNNSYDHIFVILSNTPEEVLIASFYRSKEASFMNLLSTRPTPGSQVKLLETSNKSKNIQIKLPDGKLASVSTVKCDHNFKNFKSNFERFHIFILSETGNYCYYSINKINADLLKCDQLQRSIRVVSPSTLSSDSIFTSTFIAYSNGLSSHLIATSSQSEVSFHVLAISSTTGVIAYVRPVKTISVGSRISSLNLSLKQVEDSSYQGLLTYSLESAPTEIEAYKLKFIHDISSPILEFKQFLTIGSGANRSLDVFYHTTNKKLTYVVLYDYASCFNNEDFNKDAKAMVCDQSVTPMKYVLNYNIGEIDFDQEESQDQLFRLKPHCLSGKSVISGTYDMGSLPKVMAYNLCTSESTCRFGFLEMHLGVSTKETKVHNECGVPTKYDGIVLDSWNVPEILKFKS